MQKKKTGESEELYGELGQAFNFTEGDLEANRAGFISYRQAKALRAKTLNAILVMQVTTVFFLVFTILFAFSAYIEDWALFCVAAPFALFALILIALSVDKYYSMHKDLHQRLIKDSICELWHGPGASGGEEYRLNSGSLSIAITGVQAASLKPKHSYHVYYTERGSQIVAIEEAE